jgi:hypothetical protein
MKTFCTHIMSVSLVALSVNGALAAPIFNSNEGIDYVVGSSMLTPLSLGVSYSELDRDVTIKGYGLRKVMESEKTTATLGLDLFRFVTIYGLAGGNRSDFSVSSSSSGSEYGLGIRLNILDHVIPDPLLAEDRIRLTASIQRTRVSSDFANDDLKWNDTSATVLMSLVNDIDGDYQFFPEAIALYAGATHSSLSGDISERQASWFLVGLEMYYTKRISFNVGADLGSKNTEGMHAGFNLRF